FSTAHNNRRALGASLTGVIGPVEDQLPTGIGNSIEIEIGIRGDARAHLRAEYFDAVIAARKSVDDILRNLMASRIATKTGFHGLLNSDADLNDFASHGLFRYLNSRGHRSTPSASVVARRAGHG